MSNAVISIALIAVIVPFVSYVIMKRLDSKIARNMPYESDEGMRDFTCYGAKSGYVWGAIFLIPSISIAVWAWAGSGDIILTLGVIAMALFFAVLGLYAMLAPLKRKVEFRGDKLYYQDVFGERYSIDKNDVREAGLKNGIFVIKTSIIERRIASGFENDGRILARLRVWATKGVEP